MSDQLYEQISAFADGELPEHETELLLKRLEREPELRAALVRYTAIGAQMRDSAGRGPSRDFLSRVSAAVAAEGAQPTARRVAGAPGWLRPVAGLAVAATVASVAILGIQWVQLPTEPTTVAALAPVATSPIVIGDLPVSAPPSYTVPAPTSGSPLVSAARLTNYVVAHSQYSSTLGRRSVLSGIIAEDPTPLDESGKPLEVAKSPALPADEP